VEFVKLWNIKESQIIIKQEYVQNISREFDYLKNNGNLCDKIVIKISNDKS
jgi:hypothetical protein